MFVVYLVLLDQSIFILSNLSRGICKSSLKNSPSCCFVYSSVSDGTSSAPPIIQSFIIAFGFGVESRCDIYLSSRKQYFRTENQKIFCNHELYICF